MNLYQKVKYVLGDRINIIYILSLNLFFTRVLDLIGIAAIITVCTSFIGNEYSEKISILGNIAGLSINLRLLLIFFVIFFRSIILLLLKYNASKLLFNFATDLRSTLIYFYLERPLSTLKEKKSTSYIQSSYESAARVNTFLIQPFCNIFADVLFTLIVFVLLGLYDFKLLFLLILFSIVTFISQKSISRFLVKSGNLDTGQSQNLLAEIKESLNSYPESKIRGVTDYFYKRVRESSLKLARFKIFGAIQKLIPTQLVESIVLSSIVIYTFYLVSINKTELIAESLTVLAVALSRLYPVFAQLNFSLSRLKFGVSALYIVLNDLTRFSKNKKISYSKFITDKEYSSKKVKPILDFKELSLKNISYSYDNEKKILDRFSLRIKKNSLTLLRGKSGSGKSTLIKIIAGIIKPKSGEVILNNRSYSLYDNKNWFEEISYIDQSPFIVDGSILDNICLGISREKINKNLLKESIKIAKLEDLIRVKKNGVETYIGENGNLISGGQRQRLVIARAIYYKSKILLMDEPTSSLDAELSRSFFDLLVNLKNYVTIVVVSHWDEAINYSDKTIDF